MEWVLAAVKTEQFLTAAGWPCLVIGQCAKKAARLVLHNSRPTNLCAQLVLVCATGMRSWLPKKAKIPLSTQSVSY